jgi:hypothetical protein
MYISTQTHKMTHLIVKTHCYLYSKPLDKISFLKTFGIKCHYLSIVSKDLLVFQCKEDKTSVPL